MEAGHFQTRKPLSEACMRDLSKLMAPLKGYIERTWNPNDFELASQ